MYKDIDIVTVSLNLVFTLETYWAVMYEPHSSNMHLKCDDMLHHIELCMCRNLIPHPPVFLLQKN